MKRIVSLILTFVLLLYVAVVPAFAEIPNSEYLYKDRFIEYYNLGEESFQKLISYSESYYHIDENSPSEEVDWVLIYAYTDMVMEASCWMILDDKRVVAQDNMNYPFTFRYGVYDVKEDIFYAIDNYTDFSKFKGLEEYVNDHIGRLIGDVDEDNVLSVLDATFIQRAIAGLYEFSNSDYVGGTGCPVEYISDFDRDGERSVMDATAIQVKLAKK